MTIPGYICQEIDAEVLSEQSNPILTAIIHGMRSIETSSHVRLAATQALLNSLEFTKANFDKENERNFIMEVVCEATQSKDMRINVAALQCLVHIFSILLIAFIFIYFIFLGSPGNDTHIIIHKLKKNRKIYFIIVKKR